MTPHEYQPVRLALIGAGVFARDAHLPSLANLTDQFELTAIYSRTNATAAAGAEKWRELTGRSAEISTDLPALLARPDIEAVAAVLPIEQLPAAVEQALAAGKHVLSEKPIAPTLEAGQALLNTYRAHQTSGANLCWMVGENWRYEEAFRLAAQTIQSGELGQPLTAHAAFFSPITPQSKYWDTAWRKNWQVPGGWLVDGGVHHIAALRMIVGEITAVQAQTSLSQPELAPLDTISASLGFENGAKGTYLASYAAAAPWPPHIHVVCERGALRVLRGLVEITHGGQTNATECPKFDGVERELAAFAQVIRRGGDHLNPPEEALRDLAVLHAILESGQAGATVSPRRDW
ncbi:MAG: Gfo/Idh/MocA family oxidoreductase [Caldilineaceae bacterium]